MPVRREGTGWTGSRGSAPPAGGLYPPDTVTDQPETFFVAETVREKLLLAMRQEVPYACAVRVEE
jgi:GTP-binding protein Era